jgi:putative addiction module component (TIGR02574 family)
MKTVEEVRKETTALSASEHASLVRDLTVSLEGSAAYELSHEQEAEMPMRARKVKAGKATGRPAAKALADIETKLNE